MKSFEATEAVEAIEAIEVLEVVEAIVTEAVWAMDARLLTENCSLKALGLDSFASEASHVYRKVRTLAL